MSFPELLINKRVPSSFMGERLFFDLSQGLFSSFKIDDGSRLLLKTLAARGELDTRTSVLDVGSGVGVLGISLKKRFPGMKLLMCDRDVLALEMSLHNAELNGVSCDKAFPALMDMIGNESADLVVSNVPAKAGEPVHHAFLKDLKRLLKPGGMAALVIVTPLAESFRRLIAESGHTIVFEESTANHLVLHLSPAAGTAPNDSDSPMGAAFRQEGDYTLEKRTYRLRTVYGLPEFDTPSYGTACAAAVTGELKPSPTLFLNPGQGHLAAWLAATGRVTEALFAGRDLLQLTTAAYNLNTGSKNIAGTLFPVPWPDRISDQAGLPSRIVMELDPIPKVRPDFGCSELLQGLKKEGELLCFGRSSEMHLFLKGLHGFGTVRNRKFRGFRAALLRKA